MNNWLPNNNRFVGMDRMVEEAKALMLKEQQKQEEKRKKEALMTAEEREIRRAIDTEGFSDEEVLCMVKLYKKLAPADDGRVSIKNLKEFLETVVKARNPEMYRRLTEFCDIRRERKSERKEEKEAKALEGFLNSFRTVENAFMYSLSFKEAALSMASKLDAPEEMSVTDRIKWLRIWVILICDQSMFWNDYNEEKLVDKRISMEIEECFIFPETMIGLERKYFRKQKDGNIKLQLIKDFLNLYPEAVQKEVMRFGEFGYDTPDCMKVSSIRRNIKQKLFETDWIATSSYFCTEEGLKYFEPEIFIGVHKALMEGGIRKMNKYIYGLVNPYKGFKSVNIVAYKIETGGKKRRVGVTCTKELYMYVMVYEWLKEHPGFTFGKENKTLSQYGLESLFEENYIPETEEVEEVEVSFEDAIENIILDCGLVADKKDINWKFVYKLIDPEKEGTIELVERYLNEEIGKNDFLRALGFLNEEQARKAFKRY